MIKYLLLVFTTLLLLSPLVPAGTAQQADATAEEYAVYSALIANMFAGDKVSFDTQNKVKLLVIEAQTGTDFSSDADSEKGIKYFSRMFPALSEECVKDYNDRNAQPAHLRDSFDLKTKRILVEKQELEKIFKGGGWWQEFYKRYPDSGGLIILSRVGFNAAMNQALVYIQHGCGGLCGTGHYALLEKSGDGWKVIKLNMVWIS